METGKPIGNRIRVERGWRREADGEGERGKTDGQCHVTQLTIDPSVNPIGRILDMAGHLTCALTCRKDEQTADRRNHQDSHVTV